MSIYDSNGQSHLGREIARENEINEARGRDYYIAKWTSAIKARKQSVAAHAYCLDCLWQCDPSRDIEHVRALARSHVTHSPGETDHEAHVLVCSTEIERVTVTIPNIEHGKR